MALSPLESVTTLLADVRAGRPDAESRLFERVYGELRGLAAAYMRKERPDHTLQPTALVNEAAIRLLKGEHLKDLQNRSFFFAAMAQAMRRALVEHARKRRNTKDDLSIPVVEFDDRLVDILDLDEALTELTSINDRQGQAVMLRFFGGLPIKDIAEQLGVSPKTVEGDLRFARAWLRGRLSDNRD